MRSAPPLVLRAALQAMTKNRAYETSSNGTLPAMTCTMKPSATRAQAMIPTARAVSLGFARQASPWPRGHEELSARLFAAVARDRDGLALHDPDKRASAHG
jgi:hypothetical protein